MLGALKSFVSSVVYDEYEVDGIAPLRVQDCVRHLEEAKYYVDEKLNFQHHFDEKNVEVTGYLAPHTERETLIRADVRVKVELLSFWFWFFLLLLLEVLVFAYMTSFETVTGFLGLPVFILMLWAADRRNKHRRAREEADLMIDSLHSTFKLPETLRG